MNPIVATIVAVGLIVCVIASVIRIIRGPSLFDRVIGSDMLVALIVCALVLEMLIHRHTDTLIVVLALVIASFIGTVGVTRYATRDQKVEGIDES